MTTPRPTADQMARYEAAWTAYQSRGDDPTTRILLAASASTPGLGEFLKRQFVAACFLEDILLEMGAPDVYRKDRCFTFGRMCGSRPDVWANFDAMLARCRIDMDDLTRKKEWAEVPVPQDVPPPTKLLTGWWEHAKMSRGDEGVYPQVFFHRDAADAWSIEALAVDGNTAFRHAIGRIRETRPVEFVLGVDMQSVPGQGLEFGDFLAVVWFVEGRFLTGVVDYQLDTATPPEGEDEPAFRPVRWDNNYWNHALREDHPVPAMVKALAGETP